MKLLSFDIWGNYAHYKKIYATTSAISYIIPTKISLYGYVAAILGFEKNKNQYLKYFTDKQCLLSIEILKPLIMQRINSNLRAVLGRLKETDNRKPTTIEYVYEPYYRIYFTHQNQEIYNKLKNNLTEHKSIYTPTLGLASLISNFEFKGEFETIKEESKDIISISSVIPKSKFVCFDKNGLIESENEIIEQSMYAIEMDLERNVTERDDILLDRKGKKINAIVKEFYNLDNQSNVMLF